MALKRPAASALASSKTQKYGLHIRDLHELGDFAQAGFEAVVLALDRASNSLEDDRVPISGAAVELTKTGRLRTVAIGHNGRIPPSGSRCSSGYPTDHGETAAIRQVKDVSKVDWGRVVFATTLSPCVMCGATLEWLWGLGLRRVVVAESASFSGTADSLAQLSGMTVVCLSSPQAQSMMKTFAGRFPWDWAADIGEIPPRDLAFISSFDEKSVTDFATRMSAQIAAGHQAAVVRSDVVMASAADERSQSGGNETRSAVMLAMGRAGSEVNLRECILFIRSSSTLSLREFGVVSVGACKLFRPALIVATVSMELELKSKLEEAGLRVASA
ncbi:unnamed protein product [Effrenium voratum]|nr:unnamed protein product [Effrenium voratum]